MLRLGAIRPGQRHRHARWPPEHQVFQRFFFVLRKRGRRPTSSATYRSPSRPHTYASARRAVVSPRPSIVRTARSWLPPSSHPPSPRPGESQSEVLCGVSDLDEREASCSRTVFPLGGVGVEHEQHDNLWRADDHVCSQRARKFEPRRRRSDRRELVRLALVVHGRAIELVVDREQ